MVAWIDAALTQPPWLAALLGVVLGLAIGLVACALTWQNRRRLEELLSERSRELERVTSLVDQQGSEDAITGPLEHTAS